MTRPPRTTESISRDHEAIRSIMHQARDLTVPDRATLAVGLVGNLATLMNRAQMARLLDQLREEAERVQDVPPSRQRDMPAEDAAQDGRGSDAGGAGTGRNAGRVTTGGDPDRSRAAGDDRHAGRAGAAGHAVEAGASPSAPERGRARDSGRRDDRHGSGSGAAADRQGVGPVGQAGRGEFRTGRLL